MSRAKSNYIDGIYAHIGEFSKYQLFVWILVSTVGMSTSLMGLSFSFYAATPAHRCKLPVSLYPNDTYEIVDESHRELVDKYIPTSHTSVKSNYDSCNLKEFDNSSISDNFTLVRCNEWVYSKEYFQDTLISDVMDSIRYTLANICESKYKRSVFLTLTFIGTYSTIFFGILSDKFGRKRTMYCLLLVAALLNISICVLLNTGKDNLEIRQIIFGLFRFLCGIASNLYNLSVVLAVEICGPSKRLMASNSSNYFFILGEFIVVTIAYFVRDYRILYCVYTSAVVLMLTYFWYIPESPRWLMVNEKKDKAFKVFEKIAKSNGRCLDELEELKMLNLPHDHTKSQDLIQTHYSLSKTAKILVTNKKTLIRTFVFSLNWLTNSMIYNGLSYSTSDLFGSPYSNFVISATVELVGTIIGQMVYDRYGRKIPYALSLTCSGLALLSFLFIPKGYLVNIMAMVGKFFISFTYVGIYIIIVESYPTIIRNSALSINSFISRFGSVTAPNILLLGEIYWYAMPYIIFGVLGCISATLFFIVVPETKNKQMADTIEEYIDDV